MSTVLSYAAIGIAVWLVVATLASLAIGRMVKLADDNLINPDAMECCYVIHDDIPDEVPAGIESPEEIEEWWGWVAYWNSLTDEDRREEIKMMRDYSDGEERCRN